MNTAVRNPLAAFTAIAACSLAAIFVSGCGKQSSSATKSGNAQILRVGNNSEPTDLDPQIITSLQDSHIVAALMEGLTRFDAKDLHPLPGVAERWESTPDLLTWTFHLRSNAKWSNGDPVTAGDFVYAFRRILAPAFGAEYSYMLFCIKNAEDFNSGKISDPTQIGVVAQDDHTLVLHLARPVAYLPSLAYHQSWYPVHKATIEKFGKMDQRGSAWTRAGNYVGNGAFNLAEWSPNQIIRVTKSPTYWDHDSVKLSEVDFLPIENEATEEAAFRSGQIDITSSMPIDKIAVYKAQNPELIHQSVNLATYFYRFNVTKPPFNDVRVRKALAMAIDRKQIVEKVTKGGQLPAYNLTPPDTGGYNASARLVEDLDQARQLLADAGYPGGRGFPEVEILYNTNNGHQVIAEAIQQMWRTNLGVNARLVNQEAKVWNDTMRQMDYQVARYAWVGDYLDPSTFLELMTSTSGNNQTGWKNAEYDRLVAAAGQTSDNYQRFSLFQDAEKILIDEMPIAPIYFYNLNFLMNPRVKGYYGNLLDIHPYQDVSLEP